VQLNELPSVLYLTVRGRQIEGTFSEGPDIGAWPASAMRVLRGWGQPRERDWPLTDDWPPKEPPGIDQLAKPHRVRFYQRIRNSTQVGQSIAAYRPVVASFNITNQWFDAKDGVIEMPSPTEKITAAHCVSLIGYDDAKQMFEFVNSWGANWGDRGFGYMPYEFFDTFLTEAWSLAGVTEKDNRLPVSDGQEGVRYYTWIVPDIMGGVLHAVDAYDCSTDERVGWGFAVCRDGYLDVEDFFVRPIYRRQGHGRRLAVLLLKLAGELKLPPRLWIPHVDAGPTNHLILNWLASFLRLRLSASEVPWASIRADADGRSPVCPQDYTRPCVPISFHAGAVAALNRMTRPE
jgi:GNAT superfamily N-acetyltransferase